MPLGMLVAMHCYFQNLDGSCSTFANAYVKYNHWDQMVQSEQDKFVRQNQTLVGIGGAVYLISNRKITFIPIGGCVVNMDLNPQNEAFNINYNFGW